MASVSYNPPTSPTVAGYERPRDLSDPRRWVYAALAILLVLAGIGILLGSLSAAHSGRFGFVTILLGAAVVVGLFVLALGASTALRWGGRGGGYGPHGPWARGAAGPWAWHDPAVTIARERYARGEITRDQLDQLVQGLDPSRGRREDPDG